MIKYSEEIKFSGKQILLFSTAWCPDCIILNFYIDQVVEENSDWEFIYIDSDEHPDLARRYNIFGIPSFVALSDGEVVSDLINKESKPKDVINNWIKDINLG